METIQFTIAINADVEKVWNTMLNDDTYRQWAKEFHDGSYYEGSWDKGSFIHFLGPDEEGKMSGMYSKIKENKLYEFISIEHLGMISNGIVDTTSDEVKKWTPAFENYTFTKKGNQTEIKVDMQIDTNYKAMFEEMWPKALKALKQICEQ